MPTTPQSPQPLLDAEAVSRALFALLISARLILIINQYTDIDQTLADLYFDVGIGDFPWRKSWFASSFMHVWVKFAIVGGGVILLCFTLLDMMHPIEKVTPLLRLQLRSVVLTMVLAPLAVAVLKQGSNIHCPWSLMRYGGTEPLLRLLDWVPTHWEAGRCFPAGQASTGTWLAALAAFWLPNKPRRAFGVFLAGMTAGLALGWVQQMRGAHFLTHTLATLWLTSAVLLLVLVVLPRLRRISGHSLQRRIAL